MMRRINVTQIALDLRRGSWLIKDPDVLMPLVSAFFRRQLAVVAEDEPGLQVREVSMSSLKAYEGDPGKEPENQKKVVVVPVLTAMTKYDTCDTYGTSRIAEKMRSFIHNNDVVGFVIDIDSPGGSVNSIAPMVEVIRKARAAGKPVIAHCDACYSAAYWLASQCDAIFADNENSGFGSIGAYAQFLDDREDKQTGFRVVTIYAKESPDKNLAYREALDGKPERMQQELSELVQSFHAAVKAGRPDLKGDAEGVFTGATFIAGKAIEVGLADGMATLEECIQNVFIRAEYNS